MKMKIKTNDDTSKSPKLQTYFFTSNLISAGLIIVLFSLFFFQYVSNILIKQETKAISDLTASFQQQTDSIIQNMDSVSININYSTSIKNLLGHSKPELSQDKLPSFTDLCMTINGAEVKVEQINLYDYAGNVLQVGSNTKYASRDLSLLPWIEETKKDGSKKIISIPYQSVSLSPNIKGREWYLSLYRSFYNSYGKNVGAVETIKRCKSVFKNIINYQRKNENAPKVYVYNKEGILLYPYAYAEDDLPYNYYPLITHNPSGYSFRNPNTGHKELIAYADSSYSGWSYVTVQPESVILRPARNLVFLLFGFVIAMLCGSILISWYNAKNLIKPIKQLKNEIKHTEIETLGKETTSDSSFEELEELSDSFHQMRYSLKNSMDALLESRQREVKSRTLALQSQINPHFYYNSLASAIVLAENGQTGEVITLCRNLTKIMRYITASNAPAVTLKEELNYIDEYLYCMKIRYQTSLNYMITMEPALLEEKIPKLIVQPIVENAIKYGTNKVPPWGIAIHGKIYDGYWQIDVMDSGNGFTKEALDKLHERIESAVSKPGMPDIQIEGMGMLNVYLRWKLYCGENMIFEFGNTAAGHGIVSIGRKTTKKEDAADGQK